MLSINGESVSGYGQRELLTSRAGRQILAGAPDDALESAIESTWLALSQAIPADRLIAASAVLRGADLLTIDERLRRCPSVKVPW